MKYFNRDSLREQKKPTYDENNPKRFDKAAANLLASNYGHSELLKNIRLNNIETYILVTPTPSPSSSSPLSARCFNRCLLCLPQLLIEFQWRRIVSVIGEFFSSHIHFYYCALNSFSVSHLVRVRCGQLIIGKI